MTSNLRYKALKNLARTEGAAAQSAIDQEVKKISVFLKSETRYDLLDEQLNLLKEIAFRSSEQAFNTLKVFLVRLNTLELTYRESDWMSADKYKEYYSNQTLIKKVLEIVDRIRYRDINQALEIFLDYTSSNLSDVKKQAELGLESLAKFDIDVVHGIGNFKGLGFVPQEIIIEKIRSFNTSDKTKFFEIIVKLCNEMLSSTMEGTSWSYKALTLRTGSVPVTDTLKEIRSNSISILKELYSHSTYVSQKIQVINSLQQATRPPRNALCPSELLQMVSNNTIEVLDFYKALISSDTLQIIQTIEHDAFWIYYHRHDKAIGKAALEIKAKIDAHPEYQIFKILIGFEGIFDEWQQKNEKSGSEDEKFKRIESFRTQKLNEYAASINQGNFSEWRQRIVDYSRIESNDLATFPYFFKFLEQFSKVSPSLAFELLSEHAGTLHGFIVPILKGAFETELKDKFYLLITEWISEQKYLPYIVRLLEVSKTPDITLLDLLFSIAATNKDRNLLAQIVCVVVETYSKDTQNLVDRLFLPAIRELTSLKEGRWIFNVWYNKQLKDLLKNLDKSGDQVILENLIHLEKIDYHSEEVLYPIAEKNPVAVLEFFGERLKREGGDSAYEPIPYDFQKISEPFSQIPSRAAAIVRGWWMADQSHFIHRGGRLLKICFPDFSVAFSDALIKMLQSGNKDDILFVMFILRNYEGQPFLHAVCKELVKILPEASEYLSEVRVILETTGVVGGEFGFADAYAQKKAEVETWLDDGNEKIRNFAIHYRSDLDRSIEAEKKRVKEGIELRKLEWGTGEDGAQE